MKKTIKIYFTDFWKGFNVNQNIFVDTLSRHFDIEIDPHPDYLFFSSFGYKHLSYKDCVRIYYTGENNVPDFNLCDYAIGFHYLDFDDRYLRFPLYILSDGFQNLTKAKNIDKSLASNRKFCNFVYSNNKLSDPIREHFFHQLSKYKKVDSGGKLLNNIGKPVENKLTFIRDYKFTIAFENSCVPGYTTEKMVDPMFVNSIPVYWGNPKIELDFNKESIVCVNDFETIGKVIEEIIRLDNDDDAYFQKLSQPWLIKENEYASQIAKLDSFLNNIITQPLEKVKRTTLYGFTGWYWEKQELLAKAQRKVIRGFINLLR